MRIIHRYIWKEYLQQLLLCLMGFTVLGIGKILFENNDLFIGYRMSARLVWVLLLDQIPSLWMDVLPASVLFGVIITIGRMHRDRELDVIRVAGVNLLQLASPILIGVFGFCFLAFWWNDLVVPGANHNFQVEVRRLSMQENLPLLKENVIFKGPENRFIYLSKVEHKAKRIEGVLIFETGAAGSWPRVITAKHGQIRQGVWVLFDGVIHDFDENGTVRTELAYRRMEVKMSVDYSAMMGQEKGPSEMRTGELLQLIGLYKRSGMNYPVYSVYYHQKFADPLISVVLAFLALPLSLLTGRNNRVFGLIWCFLIIMGYYTIQVIGRTMGCNGIILPWIAAWAPHLLFLVVGLFVFTAIEHRG
ncbi:MAG TPA: LptF/LptG family permease [Bacillota bacterium]